MLLLWVPLFFLQSTYFLFHHSLIVCSSRFCLSLSVSPPKSPPAPPRLPPYKPPQPPPPPPLHYHPHPSPTASMLPALCLPLWSLLSINPQRSVCLLQIRHNASDRQCNASSAAAATTKTAAAGVGWGGRWGSKKKY